MFVCDAPPGASFKVVRVLLDKEVGSASPIWALPRGPKAPWSAGGFLHGPMQVRIRGYDILIRRCEAAGIEVDPVGDWTAAEDANRGRFGFGRGRKSGIRGHGRGRRGHGGEGCE